MTAGATANYNLDPTLSRFTVRAFASGMLSFLGHSPTFTVRDFSGSATFDPEAWTIARLEIAVRADSLELADQVRATDRVEIEDRMRREVLETARYPEIRFAGAEQDGTPFAEGKRRARLDGSLALHGVTAPLAVEVLLLVFPDGVRLRGEFRLRQPAFGIRPVSAVGGTIKLKDEVHVSFDLAAVPPPAVPPLER